jgi:NAD-dependent DNA ligase
VPLDEYERVRQTPTRFLVRRGHVIPEVEEVVQRRRRYAIVEKVDRVAARVVRRLNPRARPA